MINNIQKFREKLAAGRLCLGSGITLNDPTVVEVLAPLVDFVWIDMEHNPIGVETLLGHLMAARAGGTAAIVRVPSSDAAFLKRVLDAGAEGIIVPQVRSAEEVRRVVSACRYAPLGNRGWGPRRPSDFGRRSLDQVLQEANEQLFVCVQIENTDALDDLDDIVKVEGLDSLCIGPFDLSSSMGVLAELDHPKMTEAFKAIIRKAHDAGLYVGVGDEAMATSGVKWAKLGIDWIQPGGDFGYMAKMAEQLYADIRAGAEQ